MPDIILLGFTGFTGRLIARYLLEHPQRGRFTWAVAARSKSKLNAVADQLELPADVERVQLDVTNADDVDRVVKTTRVVINAVGPFRLYGTSVVRACVRNAVHYVDITGETPWIRRIIAEFDYFATKTRAIIVPSCGFDSVVSDITAYLANKTLKSAVNESGKDHVATSLTAYEYKGTMSGGSFTSLVEALSERSLKNVSTYARRSPLSILSPVPGIRIPLFKPFYKLAIPGQKPLVGGFFIMRSVNVAVVQRTFGLLEVEAIRDKLRWPSGTQETAMVTKKQRYGPSFQYDEFIVTESTFQALLLSLSLLFGLALLMFVPPFRWVVQKIMPKSGEGPSDEKMETGYLIGTNLTTSAARPPILVKTVSKLKGDPGYLVTAVMVSECALSLLLPPVSSKSTETTATYSALPSLPPLAQKGGILTPATAFGDVLVQRLQDSGRLQFSSSVVQRTS
ncbi:hypothetical protein APHAL10511_004710 [Amanita phalloides]|nr:hypothetical protein APHAL10511_004710 [Amanita phalloides]